GASRSRAPRSTRRMITVAVIVLVTDAIWNSVSPSTGSGCSTLVTPNASTSTAPARSMPIATPGTWYRAIASRTRVPSVGSTSRDARTCARGPLGRRPHHAEAALAQRDLPHDERESVREIVEASLENGTDGAENTRRQRARGQAADADHELPVDRARADIGRHAQGEDRRTRLRGQVHARGVDRRTDIVHRRRHVRRHARIRGSRQVRLDHDECDRLTLVRLRVRAQLRIAVLNGAGREDTSGG